MRIGRRRWAVEAGRGKDRFRSDFRAIDLSCRQRRTTLPTAVTSGAAPKPSRAAVSTKKEPSAAPNDGMTNRSERPERPQAA
jgi:hypothetical protein